MAKNQNETEFFAVVATGRKGLEQMSEKMGSEIIELASSNIKKEGSLWLKRAIVSIANDDKLKDVVSSRTGVFSVYKALSRAATMGLQIGGQFPQAYLTGFGGKAELIPTAEGYKHVAKHAPGAVIDDISIHRVYEGEDFSIDFSSSSVKHTWDGTSERGKLKGVYCIITLTTGKTIVDYMSVQQALLVRNKHSSAYKNNKGPWLSDEDAMVEKTAAKKFLRPFAAESEGIAMLYSDDDYSEEEYTEPPRDVSERMGKHLGKKNESVERGNFDVSEADDAEVTEDTDNAPDPEPPEETGSEDEIKEGDIF